MAGNKLENTRVAAIMTDCFEEIEFTSPKDALESEGAVVHIISPTDRRVQGFNHLNKGKEYEVDVSIDEANPEDYDAVLLPGGVINGDHLRTHQPVLNFLRSMNEDSKPIFVICHGGWSMISAGLVRGRRITSYKTLRDDMINAGAIWLDEPVVMDENFVSSRNPGDLDFFNKAIVEMLAQSKQIHAYGVSDVEWME